MVTVLASPMGARQLWEHLSMACLEMNGESMLGKLLLEAAAFENESKGPTYTCIYKILSGNVISN